MPALVPINEEDFLLRVEELFDKSKEDCLARAKQLWHSGAIDKEAFPDNYVLPKLVVTAYANIFKESWMPVGESTRKYFRKAIRNFQHFM